MTASARKSVLVLLVAAVGCSSEAPPGDTEVTPWATRESALDAVSCPMPPVDDPGQAMCSGTIPALSSCFVSLGSDRLRREIAQTFTVGRKGQAGRVRLLLKRLQEIPTDPADQADLMLEVRPLVDGLIPLDPAYTFAFARIKKERLQQRLALNEDVEFEINLTSAEAPYTYIMDPAETYALIIRIEEGQSMAVGIACHEDPEGSEVPYADGRAYSRQMRKVTDTEFTDPQFIADIRDLSFSFTLDDGCTKDKTIECGVGQCFNTVFECVEGEFQVCEPLPPEAEVCDQLDNDCDGEVDEVVDLGTTTCGTGICERTVNNCADGIEQMCVPGPPGIEVCNGKDDNCDGRVDEVEELGTTTCGNGVCQVTADNCVGGAANACVPDLGPRTTESCNGIDDDCDGLFDEGPSGTKLTQAYWPGNASNRNKGTCQDGVQTCNAPQSPEPHTPVPASWAVTTPPVLPVAEVCDGLDNDCDGTVDENTARACWPYAPSQRNVGICADGTQQCAAVTGSGTAAWAACIVPAANQPRTETCNGLDDDCDGVVDDGLGATTCGSGLCQRSAENCVNGVPSACVPDWTKAQGEVCNGIDDDCDGLIDEDLVRPCYTGPAGTQGVGLCRTGTQTCNAVPGSGVPSWTACAGEITPVSEVNRCDNLDNNCDGTPDNPATSICAKTSNASTTLCNSGNCSVTTCNPGTFDVDKNYANGCECIDDAHPNICGTMNAAATMSTITSTPVRIKGKLPVSGASSDWIRISFPTNYDWYQRGTGIPTVAFTNNPGGVFKFEVRTYACAGGTWPGCGSALDTWQFYDNCPKSNTYCSTRARTWPTDVFVRVYRTTGGETCAEYELGITRTPN